MWYNSIIEWLLKSPMHGLASKNMMLISYTSRKSGQEFTTPVNYWQVSGKDGELLLTTSKPERLWWRNLSGGWPIVLYLRGNSINALGTIVEDIDERVRLFSTLVTKYPEIGRYFQVTLDDNNQPVSEDVKRTAAHTILVSCRLTNE